MRGTLHGLVGASAWISRSSPGAYSKIADAIVNFKPGATPDPAALAKLQKVSAEIDTNRLTQASQNIAAWLQENCHP